MFSQSGFFLLRDAVKLNGKFSEIPGTMYEGIRTHRAEISSNPVKGSKGFRYRSPCNPK
jgi:hypothetical protein